MKFSRTVSISLLLLTLGILIFRIILAFKGLYLEQVSGSWAALAVDVSKGILYRPLFDEAIGTGGTRWMPLYFVLHGGLIKLTGNAVFSGIALSLFSSILLISAVCLLLWHYRTNLFSSAVIIALLLCSNNLITAMTAVRGDILAAALNVWGIFFAVTSEGRRSRTILSCFIFTLTIMTKITSGFGIAAVVIWLWFNRGKRDAVRYASIFSIFIAVFVIIIQAASSGRFLNIFSLLAAGGTTISKFVKLPFNFISCTASTDPGSLVILITALTIMVYKGKDIIRSKYALYMAATLAMTLFIFGSEGIVGNHLIDIHIASVLVIAAFISEYRIEADMAIKCCFIVLIIASTLNAHSLKQDLKKQPLLASMRQTAELVNDNKNMISENPWLPIIMGRHVYMLDPWMFRLIDIKKPVLVESFYKRLDSGGFDCIVFDQDPNAPWIPDWFDYSHFGRNFMNYVFKTYRQRENYGPYYIYIPVKKNPPD